nr:hypothetical protein Iba_chr11bCG9750 [Ipomoea batatas]
MAMGRFKVESVMNRFRKIGLGGLSPNLNREEGAIPRRKTKDKKIYPETGESSLALNAGPDLIFMKYLAQIQANYLNKSLTWIILFQSVGFATENCKMIYLFNSDFFVNKSKANGSSINLLTGSNSEGCFPLTFSLSGEASGITAALQPSSVTNSDSSTKMAIIIDPHSCVETPLVHCVKSLFTVCRETRRQETCHVFMGATWLAPVLPSLWKEAPFSDTWPRISDMAYVEEFDTDPKVQWLST